MQTTFPRFKLPSNASKEERARYDELAAWADKSEVMYRATLHLEMEKLCDLFGFDSVRQRQQYVGAIYLQFPVDVSSPPAGLALFESDRRCAFVVINDSTARAVIVDKNVSGVNERIKLAEMSSHVVSTNLAMMQLQKELFVERARRERLLYDQSTASYLVLRGDGMR